MNQTQSNFLNKGISTPVGILIIIVLAVLVGIILVWQTGAFEKQAEMPDVKISVSVKEGDKIQKESLPPLQDLLSINQEFRSFLGKAAERYPELSPDKFIEKESTPISIIREGFSRFSPDDSVWTLSPDKTRAVSSLGYYGEPDSSLEIYNRTGDKKTELLKVCGTPCSYRGEFWLDNEKLVFIQEHEYYPPSGEIRCAVDTKCTRVVSISFYNLGKNTETIYQSPEIDAPMARAIILPSWPARDLQIKAACERLYGKGDPYCQ